MQTQMWLSTSCSDPASMLRRAWRAKSATSSAAEAESSHCGAPGCRCATRSEAGAESSHCGAPGCRCATSSAAGA
eukprot:703441-Lingulodinium_polyedra.AAC.1